SGMTRLGGMPRWRLLRALMLATALAVAGIPSHVKADIDDLRQLVIYVNAAATAGGDGSRVAPFQTIQDGAAAAPADPGLDPRCQARRSGGAQPAGVVLFG